MKICVIVNNMNEFGGLEEFAKNLAVGVQSQGHPVSFFSTVWVTPDNQYLRGLRQNGVTFIQLPKWLSMPISDWVTKEKIISKVMWLSTPLVYLLGLVLMLVKRRSWNQSKRSAWNWLQGRWGKLIGPDRRAPFVRLFLNWWKFTWKPDLIHIQGYTNDLLYIIDWAYSKGVPVIYEEHQTPDAQFDWWKDFKQSINKASMIVAVSEKSAEGLREVAGVTQPITVAYYMVPDPQETGWSPDPRLGQPGEPVRITTPVRLYVTKGLQYLLEAIVIVRKVYPHAQFRVYGDGAMRDELLDYAEKLGLDGKEIFVGAFTNRDELSRIMAQTDIFVMSSILEGLPVALLEAMSYGRPVVVTTVGGIPEAIQDGVNGLLCPPRDPQCLAEKIIAMIEDPDLRRRLGQEVRKSYEQGPHYPSKVIKQYISIYQEVLTSAAHSVS